MASAFDWLNAIFSWLGTFVPRWEIVPTTHAAVKFVGGSRVVILGAGWHVYWPLRTKFESYPVAEQAVDLPNQTLVTADDRTVMVSGMVAYEIIDIEKILAHTYSPDTTIRQAATGAVGRVVCRLDWEALKGGQQSGTLDSSLRKEVKRVTARYGVRVIRTTLTALAPSSVHSVALTQSNDGFNPSSALLS